MPDYVLSRGAVLAAHRYLFLKITAAIGGLVLLVYWWHDPPGGPTGDTWLGYTLGIASAAIVLWLSYMGIRKRRYAAGRVDLRNWLAAHVYLGLLVALLASLHSGFGASVSVHGMAYLLLLLTVLSGLYGIQAYIRYPRLITANRGGLAYDALLGQIAEIDAELNVLTLSLGDDIARASYESCRETRVTGTLRQRLSGRVADCPTSRFRAELERTIRTAPAGQAPALRQALSLLVRKETLLRRARRELQLLGWLQAWLFIHVPATCALLAAIVAHVIAVFFHW